MSSFAGVVSLSGKSIEEDVAERAGRGLTAFRPGRIIVQRSANAVFVQRITKVGAPRAQAAAGDDSRALFAADARIDNRKELAEKLGITAAKLVDISDSALLRLAFRRWGDGGVAQCLGAFSFAHWEADARRLTLGRDCLGNRPLFYYRGREFVFFASTLGGLFALPGVPREIDEIALAQFLAVNFSRDRQTLYRGIERILSRTITTIDRDGVSHREYWAPDLDTPPPFSRDDDYVDRARELFDQAVASTIRDTGHVAIATSGGLDSSAIAATAARLGTAQSITCFCQVPPAGTDIDVGRHRYLDERDKIAALAEMHPALDVHLVTPETVKPFGDRDARYFLCGNLPTPNPVGLAVGTPLPDTIAAAGHRVALIGNYGNYGLSWWGRLSLIELARARQWRYLARDLRLVARESRRSMPRTFVSEVILPMAPRALRRRLYRMQGLDLDSVAAHSALNPAFIAEAGLARLWRAQGFDPQFGVRDWNPKRLRANRLFDHNQYARDIRGLAEEIFGYEVRDPHADRRLLEFVLSVPEALYRQDGIPRSFARRVFADRLPREITEERRFGAITPIWFRSLDARRDEIMADIERLQTSRLASRVLDLPRLKRLASQWPADANEAERRKGQYRYALARGLHVGRFVRWVEGGNA